jgi:glycosyltransferase involved in cell wall biosynthesis
MTAIHQLVPAATPGDAVTGQAFAWRDLLAEWGHSGEIVAEHVHPELADEVRRLDRHSKRLLEDGSVVLRYAIHSEIVGAALETPERLAICYHNITPGDLLRAYNAEVADLCDRGRAGLASLDVHPAALIADSRFNAEDLAEAGLGEATIVPLLLDLPEEVPANGRGTDPIVISVGRIVPSKRLEDVIKAFALYQRNRAPAASLVIVGSDSGFENYRLALERLVARVGAKRVFFTGRISGEARDAWYRRAHVYLSMSVHEGFCAPLVEALANGVPVVARGAGAVPETLRDAGIVLDGDDLALVAEALHELVSSEETRRAFATAGEERLAELRPNAVAPKIRAALAPLLHETGS